MHNKDHDNPPLTDAELAKAVHARQVPDKVTRLKAKAGVRGPQKAPVKQITTVRLDDDIIARLKGDNPKGWQTRLNDTLRKALKLPGQAA